MAGITDLPAPELNIGGIQGWGSVPEAPGSESGTGSFLDALQEAQDKAEAAKPKLYDRVTGSAYYDRLVKDVIRDLFTGGADQAASKFSGMNDFDKGEVRKAIEKLIEAARDDAGTGSAKLQEMFYALFGTKEADGTTDIDSDELLKGMLLKIKEMRDASQSSDVILQSLIPYLVAESSDAGNGQAEALPDYAYEEWGGMVGFTEGNTTYRIGLQGFAEEAEKMLAIVDGNVLPDVTAPEESLPEEIIPPTEPEEELPTEEIVPPIVEELPEEPKETETDEIPEEIIPEETVREDDGEEIQSDYQRVRDKTAELLELQMNQAPQVTLVQNVVQTEAYTINTQIIEQMSALLSQAQVRNSEFVMSLNPDNLGSISVRITSRGGAVSVVLGAQNEATADLLQQRLPQLIQSLREINQNVQDVRVEAGAEAQNAGFSLTDLGPGNSRSNQSFRGRYPEVRIVSEEEQTLTEEIYKGGSRLWQTV